MVLINGNRKRRPPLDPRPLSSDDPTYGQIPCGSQRLFPSRNVRDPVYRSL